MVCDEQPEVFGSFYDFSFFFQGGARGGWEEYDHVTFTKYHKLIYQQSGNNEDVSRRRLLERLVLELPHRGTEDVDSHVDWYNKFLHLAEKKKYAITQWRKQKDHEKASIKSRNLKDPGLGFILVLIMCACHRHSVLDELDELTIGIKGEAIDVNEDDLRKAEEKRELLKAWRKHKEEEKQAALEQEKLREEAQKVVIF